MPDIQRDIGEIKANIQILTKQTDFIYNSMDELKCASIENREHIKALTVSLSLFEQQVLACHSKINRLEHSLSSKVIASFSAVIVSFIAIMYSFFR